MSNDRFRKFLLFALALVVVLMLFKPGVYVGFPLSARDVLEVLRWTFTDFPVSEPTSSTLAPITRVDVILAMAVIAWLVWLGVKRSSARIGSVAWIVPALGIWPVASLIAAVVREPSGRSHDFLQVALYIECFIVAFAFFCTLLSRRSARGMAYLFLLAGAAVVGMALSLVIPLFRGQPVEAGLRASLMQIGRWGPPARLAVLLAPAFFGCAIFDPMIFRKLFWVAATLAALAICLSGPLLIAALMAILALSMLRSERLFMFVAVLLLAVLPFLWVLLPGAVKGQLAGPLWLARERQMPSAEELPRLKGEACMTALDTVGQHIFVGAGPAARVEAPSVASRFVEDMSAEERDLLSQAAKPPPYLLLAARMGVPMLVFFIWVFFLFSRRSLVAVAETADPMQRGIVAGFFGAVLAFAAANLWTPMVVHETGLPFAFILACIWRMSEQPEEERPPTSEPPAEETLEVPLLDLS